jgi:hypothetical protein
MNPMFELDDTVTSPSIVELHGAEPPPLNRQLADIDWESMTDDGLKIYLSDEPGIGEEFTYNGVRWRIVDYRDGWVARLLV